MSNQFLSDILLLALAGLGAIAFFFTRSYLANISEMIRDMHQDSHKINEETNRRFEKLYEKLDCRLTTIEINLAVKSNTLDNYVKDIIELKERLKDRE